MGGFFTRPARPVLENEIVLKQGQANALPAEADSVWDIRNVPMTQLAQGLPDTIHS
jgi:hypothetical protein